VEGDISTYMMVFETDRGKILMNEKFIESDKYEGVEFIWIMYDDNNENFSAMVTNLSF